MDAAVTIENIRVCDEELNKEKPDPRFGKHLINSVMKFWCEKILKEIENGKK